MAEIAVHLTAPARPAFALDTVERRFALYLCERPLPLSLRGNRARLADLVELGIERTGLLTLREMASAFRYLTARARETGCPVIADELRAVWPDRARARAARALASAPVWPVVAA
ncbi:hypothetical protein L3Q67_08910 [Saccharothrix sp. AJ9571]|nr:hypothetical protein L3Q67_08910 [Saccharothrix sp. AJ9571]